MWFRRLQMYVLGAEVLRPGEIRKAALVTLYLFIVISVYIALKSVRDGLFLNKFGAAKLPQVMIAIAIGIGLVVALYIRLARAIPPTRLVTGTLVLFSSNLMLFWWLARYDLPWLNAVLYIWGGMYGAIAPTQVWTLANDVFTTRQAKRIFGLVGIGGILGGILGGGMTSVFALWLGTINVLVVLAFLLLVAAIIVMWLSRHRLPSRLRVEDFPAPRHLRDSMKLIRNSTHLKLIAGLVFITALATSVADWQFKAVIADAFSNDQLTAFFGAFYGTVGILSLLVQFFLTSRLLRSFGLGVTILLLPISMLLATVLLIPTLAVWAAVLLKGSDSSQKHSIDRSTRELAYLPVNRSIKMHVKSAIDMVVDRFGDGTAGVLLAVLLALGFGVATIGIINLVIIGVWIWMAVHLRRSYRFQLARSIAEGHIEVGSWHEAMADAETVRAITSALDSNNEPQVLAALDQVAGNPSWDVGNSLAALAREGSPEIRARAMAILLHPSEPGLPDGVTTSFQHEDQTLMAECIDLMTADDPVARAEMAQAILRRAGGHARGAWVALLARRLGPEFRPFTRTMLTELAASSSPANSREAAATAIGLIPRDYRVDDLLDGLFEDPDPAVRAAAARSAGTLGGDDHLARVLPLLGSGATRAAADRALRSRGDEGLALLLKAAEDDTLPADIRKWIPGVMARLESQRSIAALVGLLEHDEAWLADAVEGALFRFRQAHPDVSPVPQAKVRELALDDARSYRRRADLVRTLESPELRGRGVAADLALVALRESLERRRAKLFRTLSLYYPAGAIQNCRKSLDEGDHETRANAAELLDNLSPRALWRELLPILYPETEHATDSVASVTRSDVEDAVVELAGDDTPWVRACALWLAAEIGVARAVPHATAAANHRDPRLRDAAAHVLRVIEGDMESTGEMGILDKVVALRTVSLFEGTPSEQLSLIATVAREVMYPAGAVLYRQDDPAGDMFVLIEGNAIVERGGQKLGEVGSGEALGVWGLFDEDPRQATVRAEVDCRVLRIDRWGFDELLMEHPEVSRALVRQMVRRVRAVAGGSPGVGASGP